MSDQTNTLILLSSHGYNFRKMVDSTMQYHPVFTNIVGKNESGKSTHLNGHTWLISRRDVNNREDYEIQTKDEDGLVQERLDSFYEEKFLHNGAEVSLRREYYQHWKPKDGQVEDSYDSMKTKYFINDAPVDKHKEASYNAAVALLIGCDFEAFKIMTIPSYFLEMEAPLRRAALVKLVGGDLSDDDIIAQFPLKYGYLKDALKLQGLESYKKGLNDQKKKLETALAEIGGSIKENLVKLKKEQNWEALQQEKESLQKGITETEKQIAGLATGKEFDEHNKNVLALAQLEADKSKFEIEFKQGIATHNATLEAKRLPFNSEIATNNAKILELDKLYRFNTGKVIIEKPLLEGIRKKYRDEEQKPFPVKSKENPDAVVICAECGRPFTDEELVTMEQLAIKIFNDKKAENLAAIQKEGIEKNKYILDLQQKGEEAAKQIEALTAANVKLQKKVDAIKLKTDKVEDDKDYKKILADIDAKKKIIANPPKVNDEELQVRLSTYTERLEEIDGLLPNKKFNEDVRKRDEELQKNLKKKSQEIFDQKRLIQVTKEFSQEKSQILEDKVNELFDKVQFDMYEENASGNLVEICRVNFKGVPYAVVNTAGKILMFMDIADTYSRLHNTVLPRFIDSAESVDEIPETRSQVIALTVDKRFSVPTVEGSAEYDEGVAEWDRQLKLKKLQNK